MSEINKVCYCNRSECFAAEKSQFYPDKYYCKALHDNNFGKKECPFFKTKEEQELSLHAAALRKIVRDKEKKEKARKQHVRQVSGVEYHH